MKIIDFYAETKLEQMTVSEEKMLESLNKVSTAKRLANMVRNSHYFVHRLQLTVVYVLLRIYTIPTLGNVRRFTRSSVKRERKTSGENRLWATVSQPYNTDSTRYFCSKNINVL